MKMTLLIIAMSVVLSACSQDSAQVADTPASDNGISSGQVNSASDQPGEEFIPNPMPITFDDALLIYRNGKVGVVGDPSGGVPRERVMLAQDIITANSLELAEGAKIYLYEETQYDRLIFQNKNVLGELTGEVTVIADKNTHELVQGVIGTYMGLPEI